MESPARAAPSRFPEWLLAAVVLLALGLAVGGIVEESGELPEGAVARVNGQILREENLDRLLQRLEQQTGRPVGAAERAEVLSRLVDEELLLQQGLALDLPRAEARLRSQIVQELIRQAVAGSAALPVDERELIDFHAANRAYFRRPDRLLLRAYLARDSASAQRLATALGQGAPLEPDPAVQPLALPDGAVTPAKLADYIGSPLAARLASLAVGQVIDEPLADGAGVRVLQLLAREPGAEPSFEELRPRVETEFRRRRDEAALQDYLAGLREAARIVRKDSP